MSEKINITDECLIFIIPNATHAFVVRKDKHNPAELRAEIYENDVIRAEMDKLDKQGLAPEVIFKELTKETSDYLVSLGEGEVGKHISLGEKDGDLAFVCDGIFYKSGAMTEVKPPITQEIIKDDYEM